MSQWRTASLRAPVLLAWAGRRDSLTQRDLENADEGIVSVRADLCVCLCCVCICACSVHLYA